MRFERLAMSSLSLCCHPTLPPVPIRAGDAGFRFEFLYQKNRPKGGFCSFICRSTGNPIQRMVSLWLRTLGFPMCMVPLFVGALGIEPRSYEPESYVLPLYYAPLAYVFANSTATDATHSASRHYWLQYSRKPPWSRTFSDPEDSPALKNALS